MDDFCNSELKLKFHSGFQDEKARIMRRTIMRYLCLSATMCFTLISPRVKKRFPTLDHFVEAGMLEMKLDGENLYLNRADFLFRITERKRENDYR